MDMSQVTIIRSAKRKTVGIRILPNGTVKVSAPLLYPQIFINSILKKNQTWIREKQQLMIHRSVQKIAKQYWYLGKQYDLVVRSSQKEIIEVADKLYIASNSEKFRDTYLMTWYKNQARKVIFARAASYAARAKLHYSSIGLTSAQTRWGSCSSQRSLNFNWKLVMAPLEVIDYVVVHELAHLTHLNHSHEFWEEVRRMYPLYRSYRTWLKRYGHLLTI